MISVSLFIFSSSSRSDSCTAFISISLCLSSSFLRASVLDFLDHHFLSSRIFWISSSILASVSMSFFIHSLTFQAAISYLLFL
nr:MAG TPA: hypothetical protein [Caudoviricetes sp.]